MPYRVKKSIDIDFAHHVHGHAGPCINIHGHTWKFEVEVQAENLGDDHFVIDFKDLKTKLLEPIHNMLDHGFAIWNKTLFDTEGKVVHSFQTIGEALVATREGRAGKNRWLFGADVRSFDDCAGNITVAMPSVDSLNGATDYCIGGIKIIGFPFPPSSETLARWLYETAHKVLVPEYARLGRTIQIRQASVYETLHPVESVATYTENW
jgi:6-pyruvoyl tetrahydropterin synthase/QueD family protein